MDKICFFLVLAKWYFLIYVSLHNYELFRLDMKEEKEPGPYLYSHHRQHLHRDPVELIKAAPSPCLSQAFVDVPTGLIRQKEAKTVKWQCSEKQKYIKNTVYFIDLFT